ANEVIQKKQINSVYIDPLTLDLDAASAFIFGLRRSYPWIVFVLYYDFEAQPMYSHFFQGERERFQHYFKLDKGTPGPQYNQRVQETVNACQSDLAYRLTQEHILSLKRELVAIQAEASNETALIPLKILKE